MPKYRKLYVKTTESLDLNDMPDDTYRLLWVMLPLGLCREGRGIDNPAWIKAKIMPLRQDVTEEMIIEMMDWFVERKMIVRYEAKKRNYFYIPTFHDYQGNTTREAESNYPPPNKLLKSKSGVSQEEVVGEQRGTRTASASEYMNNESKSLRGSDFPTDEYQNYLDNGTPAKEQLYSQITQQGGISSGAIDTILNDLGIVIDYYKAKGVEIDTEHGKRVFSKWCNTTGKSGSKYKRTNPGWVQWWIDELAPLPIDQSHSTDLPSYLFIKDVSA